MTTRLVSPEGRWTVRVGAEFEAAHALRDYVGGPEPLHGHSWRVEIAIETDRLGDYDLAVDFVPTRSLLKDLASTLDTANLNDIPPFDRVNPSTENLARWFAAAILDSGHLEAAAARLVEVTVWEGPHNRVSWTPRQD